MSKILIVDDDPSIRAVVKILLSKTGHDVIEAPGGGEALELLENILPDLILLDIMMPRLDGWETLNRIRWDERFKSIPVAMLTAKPLTPEILARKEINELVDYIQKPFTKEKLLRKIDKSLIEDLEQIDETKSKMVASKEGRDKIREYEIAARSERLHKSLKSTLNEVLDKPDSLFNISEIEEAIETQDKAVDMFKKHRKSIEKSLKD